jgi:hypothetical protein
MYLKRPEMTVSAVLPPSGGIDTAPVTSNALTSLPVTKHAHRAPRQEASKYAQSTTTPTAQPLGASKQQNFQAIIRGSVRIKGETDYDTAVKDLMETYMGVRDTEKQASQSGGVVYADLPESDRSSLLSEAYSLPREEGNASPESVKHVLDDDKVEVVEEEEEDIPGTLVL